MLFSSLLNQTKYLQIVVHWTESTKINGKYYLNNFKRLFSWNSKTNDPPCPVANVLNFGTWYECIMSVIHVKGMGVHSTISTKVNGKWSTFANVLNFNTCFECIKTVIHVNWIGVRSTIRIKINVKYFSIFSKNHFSKFSKKSKTRDPSFLTFWILFWYII